MNSETADGRKAHKRAILWVAPILFLLAGCASGAGEDGGPGGEEDTARSPAVTLLLSETVPAGTADGEIVAVTTQTFQLGGRRDFLIGKGSTVKGRYQLAFLEDTERWQLTVDWYDIDAKGPSRARNLGRRPPFYTLELLEAPAGLSPELPKGSVWPMRLFNLRERNSDFEHLVVIGG